MKKNAILIAGIMCAAGLSVKAAPDNGDFYPRDHTIQSTENVDRTPQGNPVVPADIPTASQYDPASVNSFHADSSIRGGSNEARGLRNYGRTDYDTAAKPMNPAVQADSSVAGGSWQARNRDWNSQNPEPPLHRSSRIKADSSIRGGSNEARGYNHAAQSDERLDQQQAGANHEDGDLYLFYFEPRGQSSGLNAQSDFDMDQGDLSNANSSDDLLPDGQANTRSQSYTLDDMDSDSVAAGAPAASQSGSSSSKITSNRDLPGEHLNSSKNLEKDISGEYSLNQSSQSSSSTSSGITGKSASQIQAERMSGTSSDTEQAVGGPGSTESGSNSSVIESHQSNSSDIGSAVPENDLGITTDSQKPLFKNNRAQGVGSLATGEFGVANSQGQNSSAGNDQLAQQVKAALVNNATGTFGVSRSEARNIQVSANGGVVTLKGAVPSQRDKQMVEVRVSEMKGVDRVDNQLTVSPKANPSARDLDNGRNLEDKTDQLQH